MGTSTEGEGVGHKVENLKIQYHRFFNCHRLLQNLIKLPQEETAASNGKSCQNVAPNSKSCQNVAEQLVDKASHR